MSSLFDDDAPEPQTAEADAATPLAERMRPRTLDEVVGQEETLGPGKPLREAIERDLLQSIILWGPPGTGKTTLARVIAAMTRAHFVAVQRRARRHQGDQGSDGGGAAPSPARRHAHHRLRRRDSSFQQGAAGRISAARRSRRHHAHRRHHRESVVRGQRRAAVAFEGLRAAAADREAVETILRRALDDRERGLARSDIDRLRRRDCGHRPVRQRRRALGAQPAGVRGRLGADGSGDLRPAARSAAARAVDPAASPALRQGRRGALQPDLGAAQVDAQQRSGCGRLLGGAHARSRRGSALHRATPCALRLRGHRQRRPAGAHGRHRRQGSGALHGHARGQHRARAGRHLPGHGAQEQRRLRRLQCGRRRRAPAGGRTGATASAECADEADEVARVRQGLRVCARRAGCVDRHGLPAAVARRDAATTSPTDRGFEKEILRRLEGWRRIKAERKRQ